MGCCGDFHHRVRARALIGSTGSKRFSVAVRGAIRGGSNSPPPTRIMKVLIGTPTPHCAPELSEPTPISRTRSGSSMHALDLGQLALACSHYRLHTNLEVGSRMSSRVPPLARGTHAGRTRRGIVHWLLIGWLAFFANATVQACCHTDSLMGADMAPAHAHAGDAGTHSHDHPAPTDPCVFVDAQDVTAPGALASEIGAVAAKVLVKGFAFFSGPRTDSSKRRGGPSRPGAITHPLQSFGRLRI